MKIIGFEGNQTIGHPLHWGAAAIRKEDKFCNAVISYSNMMDDIERFTKLVRDGCICPTEIPIPVKDEHPYFVMSILKNLAQQAPYSVKVKEIHQIYAIESGPTKTYYIFKCHEHLTSWLYHLHAGPYFLVPQKYAPII